MRPPLCENMCVRSLGYIVGASPPLCVHSIANTVGASPPRVCPFIGRQSSLDPCMLPTPLCGIFKGIILKHNCEFSSQEAKEVMEPSTLNTVCLTLSVTFHSQEI